MSLRAALLMFVALAGCGAARTQEGTRVEPGAEITLAPGATASVAGAQMSVRFVAVTEDSRCPLDVTCVWAGEVKVQLAIRVSGTATQATVPEGDSTVAGEHRVTVLRVEPRPTSTARIAAGDYRATLQIDEIVAPLTKAPGT
jgi:hypothetical protein